MVIGGVIGVVLVLVVFSFAARPVGLQVDLRDIAREAAQLHEMAAQDSDPAISLQHATTAVAYLSVARKLASDRSIQEAANVVPADLDRMLKDKQAAAVKALRVTKSDPTIASLLAGYSSL